MGLYILLAIILLPLIEIAVFIAVGQAIGIFPTVLLTVLTAIAGTLMLRQQGLSLVARLQNELGAGKVPEAEIMHGAMIVLASVFLLIPGFVTDAIGLLLFVPPVREALARFVISRSNVVIVNPGAGRRSGDHVVDLDEADWTSKSGGADASADGATDGQVRISPWSESGNTTKDPGKPD
ncbi:FxsA family protein [Roseibium sediminis]|uniref:FxsA family protein n=1 Tax=Roseibium sediminis TaxID=1775174 RepID=UPI001864FDB7|nr:FxsA family protein [Roseibium sediminis]